MNKTVLGVLALASVLVAAGGGYWFGTQRGPAPVSAVANGNGSAGQVAAPGKSSPGGGGAPVAVEAVKVALQPMPQAITAVGSMRSDESITVRPEVAGRISAIKFQEGSFLP